MKAQKCIFVVSMCLTFGLHAVKADRGDMFLSVMPMVSPFTSSEAMFGGGLNLSMGANERTEIQFELDWTAQPGYFDNQGFTETRYLIGSLFTPYFGDIRPRFGGSFGLIHALGSGGVSEVGFNTGVHLQGLWDLSQAVRLFAEANPNFSFGKYADLSTLIKVGMQFRLTK